MLAARDSADTDDEVSAAIGPLRGCALAVDNLCRSPALSHIGWRVRREQCSPQFLHTVKSPSTQRNTGVLHKPTCMSVTPVLRAEGRCKQSQSDALALRVPFFCLCCVLCVCVCVYVCVVCRVLCACVLHFTGCVRGAGRGASICNSYRVPAAAPREGRVSGRCVHLVSGTGCCCTSAAPVVVRVAGGTSENCVRAKAELQAASADAVTRSTSDFAPASSLRGSIA